jgi:hypothetical protein
MPVYSDNQAGRISYSTLPRPSSSSGRWAGR